MSFELNNIGNGISRFNFSRVFKGYNPEEVERVLIAYDKQNYVLTQQKIGLETEIAQHKKALAEFESRFQKLAIEIKALETERNRESSRLITIIANAQKTAEETVAHAKREADAIVLEARLSAAESLQNAESSLAAVNAERERHMQSVRACRAASNRHFDAIEGILGGELLPERAEPALPTVAQQSPAALTLQASPPAPPPALAKETNYEEFLRLLGKNDLF
ncbi:MAG: DivIVA domain-containing protein [Clostridiales bacterium]|nr:DivIVA domain-containing protein [Clostridiales bacterium]